MSIFSRVSQWLWGKEFKKLFELNRVGVNGRPQEPETNRTALMNWQRKNEIIYACIRKKCEAASDPEPIVERFNPKTKSWETVEGHPLVALLKKPNPDDTFDTFLTAWIGSEETTGDFYAEIARGKNTNQPKELYPIRPDLMKPIPQGARIVAYEFNVGNGQPVKIDAKDVLHRRKPDLMTRFYGLAPLKVAVGAADSDLAQTDFVRSFFHSDGIPSGLLHIKNKSMSQEEAEDLQDRWMARYSRNGHNYKEVAVLDENATFQQIGSSLKDVEADVVRMQNETRLCMIFGVPPALIGSYVGLKLATNNATMRTHLTDFWQNTMSPMLKSMRVFLDWNLLPEFEPIEDIRAGKVRVNWDMSRVLALQEDDNQRHKRARENFSCGGWTLNQFLEATGAEPLKTGGDIRLIPSKVTVVNDEQLALLGEMPEPKQLGGEVVDAEIIEEPKANNQWLDVVMNGKSTNSELVGILQKPTEIVEEPKIISPFEEEKNQLLKILFSLRQDLIKQSLNSIDDLTLTPPPQAYSRVKKFLQTDRFAHDGLNDEAATKISEIVVSRIIAEVQETAVNWKVTSEFLGTSKEEMKAKLKEEIEKQSRETFEVIALDAVESIKEVV